MAIGTRMGADMVLGPLAVAPEPTVRSHGSSDLNINLPPPSSCTRDGEREAGALALTI